MLNTFIDYLKNFYKKTCIILKYGLYFCFSICLISISILIYYDFFYNSPNLFYIGTLLFKLSLTFAIEFIICGFVVDFLKKEAT